MLSANCRRAAGIAQASPGTMDVDVIVASAEKKAVKALFGEAQRQAFFFSTNRKVCYIIRSHKSRQLRWAGHVARMEQSKNAYRVLVGKPDEKRPLGRPRRRWEDNIKMDLREVGCDPGELIDLAEDRDQWRAYVRAVRNLRIP